jgi:hypothetical protein
MSEAGSAGDGTALPPSLAGRGGERVLSTSDAPQEERALTRIASRCDLSRKRER